MPNVRRSPSASTWTRLLLAALGLTCLGLVISAFLATLLSSAGDAVGARAFSAFNLGLASILVLETITLLAVIAVRLELRASGD